VGEAKLEVKHCLSSPSFTQPSPAAAALSRVDNVVLKSLELLFLLLEAAIIKWHKMLLGSAKVREGVPNDELCDLGDRSILDAVWTGVLPLCEQFGEPVPGPYNVVKDVPEHLTTYKECMNKTSHFFISCQGSKREWFLSAIRAMQNQRKFISVELSRDPVRLIAWDWMVGLDGLGLDDLELARD
jgi:hypothetical protein